MGLQYEELVNHPATAVQSLCNFLCLDFYPDMLEPYKEKNQRMTDGVELASKMSGDLKFHLHEKIEPEAANRWKQYHTSNFLSEDTCHLATLLGYEEFIS